MVKNIAKNNRLKGHTFERKLAKTFRDIGYTYCKTSREASRILDASKVDLAFLPYNVQAKNVLASINYHDLFESMESCLKDNFPPTDAQRNYPKMIFHKRGRTKYDRLVIMQQEEFIELLKKIKDGERNNISTSK